MSTILVIDDDASLREVVAFMLKEAGHEVVLAADGDTGIVRLQEALPDLVVTDIRMPCGDGMDVLRHLRAMAPEPASLPVPVVVLTAHGTVAEAVAAMKLGAFSYLLKPFERDELVLTAAQALRSGELEHDNRTLRRLLRQKADQPSLIYRSASMRAVMEEVGRAAPSDVSVLITGESGTGKELIARALHDQSPRWDRPFVAINCGALPGELLESELFGHRRGAFTGADRDSIGRIRRADGGTLFLDEIAELPLTLQPKLLRVLESRHVDPVGGAEPIAVDFRLVCATNRRLDEEVAAGRFREDLYYRLAIMTTHLAPLRRRRDDILPLWDHFTRLHGGSEVASDETLHEALRRRDWPGNVRELRNLNQRLVLMRSGDLLGPADLSSAEKGPQPPAAGTTVETAGDAALPLAPMPEDGFSLPDLEKEIIRLALLRFDGNKSRAAGWLRIPRHVLVYRVKKFGL